jgi:hypothetical protein
MTLGRSILATGVLVGVLALSAAWAAGARREARVEHPNHAASSAGDERIAALEARLTGVERALALLAVREAASEPAITARPAAAPVDSEATSAAAAEPAPPADADRALRALYGSLDRRLEVERPDPAWRPEAAILDAIRSLPSAPVVVSTDCVSAFCRLELAHRTPEDRDASAEQVARLRPFAAGTMYRQDPADPLRMTLYVQRPGHPFGEEASPPEP